MTGKTHNDRQITDYLLGALPADEAERLDELSVADDEFAQRLASVENDLVDAYVQGELQTEILARFRAHYLASRRRQEKVEFARSLRAATLRIAPGPQPQRRAFPFSGFGWPWGLAAASLLIAVMGWLTIDNLRLRREQEGIASLNRKPAEQRAEVAREPRENDEVARMRERIAELEKRLSVSKTPAVLAFHLSPPLRGSDDIPTLAIRGGADFITIRLEVESTGYESYRAEVKAMPQNKAVFRSERLRAYRTGGALMVAVTFVPALLRGQMYVVALSGVSASGAITPLSNYPFRVVSE